MVSGTSPSLPYVCRYDTVEDVMQQREKIPEKNEGESTSSACALQPSLSAAVFPCVLLPTLSFLSAAEQKKKGLFPPNSPWEQQCVILCLLFFSGPFFMTVRSNTRTLVCKAQSAFISLIPPQSFPHPPVPLFHSVRVTCSNSLQC